MKHEAPGKRKRTTRTFGWRRGLLLGSVLLAVGFSMGRFSVTWSDGELTEAEGWIRASQSREYANEIGQSLDELNSFPKAFDGGRSMSPSVDSPHSRFLALAVETPSPARNERMGTALRELATLDPDAALALADAQENLKAREFFRLQALKGWAERDAGAAIAFIADWPSRDREEAFASIFEGVAASDPRALVELGRRAIERSDFTKERGFKLMQALAVNGAFELSADFARELGRETGSQTAWMNAAYQKWAEYQPEQAAVHALRRDDAKLMNAAFNSVVLGWAQTAPNALANFALSLPEGPERSYALSESLRQWVELDPLKAAEWIDSVEPSPEFDVGILALATNPYLGEGRPEVAASWAESLHDPILRSETLSRIVRQWAASDKRSAFRYVQSSRAFPEQMRAELLSLLEPSG